MHIFLSYLETDILVSKEHILGLLPASPLLTKFWAGRMFPDNQAKNIVGEFLFQVLFWLLSKV